MTRDLDWHWHAASTTDSATQRLASTGWRPLLILGAGMGMALALTPWTVLRVNGLGMSGHLLVTSQLMLGFVTLVLMARTAMGRPANGGGVAVVLLAIGAAIFTAMSGSTQVRAFSLEIGHVHAFDAVRAVVFTSAGLAATFGLIGALHHRGERRLLEIAVMAQCGLIAIAAATWTPLSDITHPMS